MYQQTLDGQQVQRFDAQIEKFLTDSTPESALAAKSKFQPPLRQLKDRGGNLRALGVWCQGDGYDLFVVQAIYLKESEAAALGNQYVFAERGEDFTDRLDGLDQTTLSNRVSEWRANEDLLVFTPADL